MTGWQVTLTVTDRSKGIIEAVAKYLRLEWLGEDGANLETDLEAGLFGVTVDVKEVER